jgi:hypothetical protein
MNRISNDSRRDGANRQVQAPRRSSVKYFAQRSEFAHAQSDRRHLASWLCYYRALQLAPASRVAPVDKLSLVVAIALGVLVLLCPDTRLPWLRGT